MCTREEVKLEVEQGERRMEAKLEQYAMGNSKVISNLFADVKDTLTQLDEKMDNSILDRNSIHSTLEKLMEVQQKTLEQTQRTNGRVSKLENWKSFILGSLAILTTLVLPVVFMVISEVIKHINL